MSNQTTGVYRINPLTEWRLFDQLPRAVREVYAAAPYKYAIEPRFNDLIRLSPQQARRAMIEAICNDIMKSARQTYGADHPDAQMNRLDARRRAP